MSRYAVRTLTAAVLFTTLSLAGCGRGKPERPAMTPEVVTVSIQPEQIMLTTELPGRTCACRLAEIRPQVNGLIQKRRFTEGAEVKAGELLYEIDAAPYQAALDSATANLLVARKAAERAKAELASSMATLRRHQAVLTLAKTNFKRYETLIKANAVSMTERDQGVADVEVAESGLKAAEAQVETGRAAFGEAEAGIKQADAAVEAARINLNYTKITAPIAGRIGRSNVTDGAIATAYQPAPLASVQQLDPIYVDVTQSTVEVLRLKRSLEKGNLQTKGTDKVKILLEDGAVYPQPGSLQFCDVTVDPTTGSVVLRIVVPNPQGTLLPGMFVRAILEEGVRDHAILIPQQAVSRDPKGNPLTLIVDDSGKVQQRQLSTDRSIDDKWLVSSGLAVGDKVIVEGMQKVRPGMTVKAIPSKSPGSLVADRQAAAGTTAD
jgi:membrane fusion protein, multidrug efflux system